MQTTLDNNLKDIDNNYGILISKNDEIIYEK